MERKGGRGDEREREVEVGWWVQKNEEEKDDDEEEEEE